LTLNPYRKASFVFDALLIHLIEMDINDPSPDEPAIDLLPGER
jgi:hypothetical protein